MTISSPAYVQYLRSVNILCPLKPMGGAQEIDIMKEDGGKQKYVYAQHFSSYTSPHPSVNSRNLRPFNTMPTMAIQWIFDNYYAIPQIFQMNTLYLYAY